MDKRGIIKLLMAILCFCALIAIFIFFLSSDLFLSPSTEYHLACVSNSCSLIEGVGVDECSAAGSFCGCLDTDANIDYSDGLNFFSTGVARNSTSSLSDSCSISGRLIEAVCFSDGTLSDYEVACESFGDFVCMEGACTRSSNSRMCNDTDGGLNYQIFGSASSGSVRFSDYCALDGKLAEVYCSQDGDDVLVNFFDCASLGFYLCDEGQCVSRV